MEMVHFIPPGQRRLVLLAAQGDSAPVLIYGSSGTGKSAVARWIHRNSPRSVRPLVNAQKKDSLYHQILEAQGGTLLIPEIGEWGLAEQNILFKFLKTRCIPHPEHPDTHMLLNVRVVATAGQPLEARAQAGLFNPELLRKLNVFRVQMPDLAQRSDEFEDIVLGILNEITKETHKEYLRHISEEAWAQLKGYEWPGNLRELRNVLRVAILNAQGDRLDVSDFPQFGHHHVDYRATREEFERIYLLEVLATADWEIEKASELSRIPQDTFITKMKHHEISQHEPSL
jgi:DNA-binding NtrC family response regulator